MEYEFSFHTRLHFRFPHPSFPFHEPPLPPMPSNRFSSLGGDILESVIPELAEEAFEPPPAFEATFHALGFAPSALTDPDYRTPSDPRPSAGREPRG